MIVDSGHQRMRDWRRWLACAWAVLAIGSVAGPSLSAQEIIAFRQATVETMGPAGRLERATIVVENGRIHSVGIEIPIPDRARIIDLAGKTVIPGIVDPYFVVDFPLGAEPTEEVRTITVRGRGFQVPQAAGSPAVFVKIADVFDSRRGDWNTAIRSGITTSQVVTRGYGQSVFANPWPTSKQDSAARHVGGKHPMIVEPAGRLFTAVTNDSSSLRTIREGLAEPRATGQGGARRGAPGGRGAGSGEEGSTPPSNNQGGTPSPGGEAAPAASPSQDLWRAIRSGQHPLFVNANNAAAILYVLAELEKTPSVQTAAVASGGDWYLALPALENRKVTAILPPRLDTEPRNQNRVNVPKMLHEAGIEFAFSLSTGQSEYRSTQPNPLFPVAMLVKSGLPRTTALEALTIRPARLLGLGDQVGSIEPGKRADLVVFDADPLDATAEVVQVWIGGQLLHGE
ncbi:MAG TPA: amidohydrolase family protein [Pirellulaceae bacterium]|nr:amidohydrolase family protein [Pirellulaceae bacterium]